MHILLTKTHIFIIYSINIHIYIHIYIYIYIYRERERYIEREILIDRCTYLNKNLHIIISSTNMHTYISI